LNVKLAVLPEAK